MNNDATYLALAAFAGGASFDELAKLLAVAAEPRQRATTAPPAARGSMLPTARPGR